MNELIEVLKVITGFGLVFLGMAWAWWFIYCGIKGKDPFDLKD